MTRRWWKSQKTAPQKIRVAPALQGVSTRRGVSRDAAPGGWGYDAAIMGQTDEQKERRRLEEWYASLEEGELKEIAGDAGSLTRAALEALRSEMLRRGMQAPPAEREASETPSSVSETPGPVMVGRYRDSGEAMIAKSMLDSAGIECFWAM